MVPEAAGYAPAPGTRAYLALGGGDAVPALRGWRERIHHVQMKDFRRSVSVE